MTENSLPEHAAHSPLLHAWLRTATWWLCPEAAASAQREYTEHFVSGVTVHMSNGLEQVSAEAAALRDLGPPRAARRQLRKTDFTIFEALVVAQLLKRPVKGVPYFKGGGGRPTDLLMLALLLAMVFSSYYFASLEHGGGAGGFGVVSISILMSLMNSVPSWLHMGADAREANAALVARIRQVAVFQAVLFIAAVALASAGISSYLMLRETYTPATSRYLIDFAHVAIGFATIGMAAWPATTFSASRKLARRAGPIQP